MSIRHSKKASLKQSRRAASRAPPKKRRLRIDAAIAQQAATAEILRAISQSYADATPVFEAIVAHAMRLCDANFAFVMLQEERRLRLAARTACTRAFAAYLANGLELDRRTTSGRAALTRKPVQVLDFRADPEVVVTP